MKSADELLLIIEGRHGNTVAIKRKKPPVKRRTTTVKKTTSKKTATKKRTPAKKKVPSSRVKTKQTSKATTGKLVRSTKTVRSKQHPVNGKPDIFQTLPNFKEKRVTIFARTNALTEGFDKYTQVVVFQNVEFTEEKTLKNTQPFTLPNGNVAYMPTKFRRGFHKAKVRCSCLDYKFMWMWWNNQKEGALWGRAIPYTKVAGSNRGPVNPDKTPGLCKHIIKLLDTMSEDDQLTKR